jgi:hypothetical protein
MVDQAHPVEQAIGALDVLGREAAGEALPERHVAEPPRQDVLHHRQPLDERVFLKDHPDPPPLAAQRATRGR